MEKLFPVAALVFICLVFLGSAVFWALEDWTYLDALYYASQTATAVGTGDVAPVEDGSKIFFLFYSVVSVVSFLVMFTTFTAQYVTPLRTSKR